MLFRLCDNSKSDPYTSASPECGAAGIAFHRDHLREIAEVDLRKPVPGLLLFPRSFENFNDDRICGISGGRDDSFTVETRNTMGFVGVGGTELTIASRFARDDRRDYFLHYMLQKVLSINVVNLDTTTDRESIQDFLPYLFPAFLKKALAKGLFRKYRYNEYNDANVRGVIDVPRHIRDNNPFAGAVAYRTREYSRDNELTQLARHTIEYLRTRSMWRPILYNDPETRSNARTIEECTPAYTRRDRSKIVAANRTPVSHPYFTEYRDLQKLCLQILRGDRITFGGEKDQIHGLLFDGAWLWEEYVAKVFEERMPAIEHKTSRDRLFLNDEDHLVQGIIPDFIAHRGKSRAGTASFLADTKYKHVDTRSNAAAREDYYQIITYMCRYERKTGYILFPCMGENVYYWKGRIANTRANTADESAVIELGLPIPQGMGNFADFCEQVKKSEADFVARLHAVKEAAA